MPRAPQKNWPSSAESKCPVFRKCQCSYSVIDMLVASRTQSLKITLSYQTIDFRWLCNPNLDVRSRKWAIEGLAYLTNDADVKDDFVEDEPAMRAMFELAKVGQD